MKDLKTNLVNQVRYQNFQKINSKTLKKIFNFQASLLIIQEIVIDTSLAYGELSPHSTVLLAYIGTSEKEFAIGQLMHNVTQVLQHQAQ